MTRSPLLSRRCRWRAHQLRRRRPARRRLDLVACLRPPAFANRSTPRSRDRPTSRNLRSAPESTWALRTDLELARQEIRRLRGERDELRRHLQGTLGQQLTNLSATPLVERIATLSQKLTHTRQANRDLTGEVTGLRDELDAARRALRQMIKNTAAERTALTGKR